MENELRPFWNGIFHFNWKFGLFLLLIICIPRFLLVLYANSNGNYSYIGMIMFVSAIAPFIFLNKYGRKKIGIIRSGKYNWLIIAFATGLIISFVIYYIGNYLYGDSYENWYKYIARSYRIPAAINSNDKTILFVIMALTGMIFSPIGEELFFRGIIHASFAKSLGEKKAAVIDSSAFAITHVSHFGLVFVNNKWQFFTVPALIWVLSMFLVSILFFTLKKYSGSILGAIICHSAFNLGMIFCIFYLI